MSARRRSDWLLAPNQLSAARLAAAAALPFVLFSPSFFSSVSPASAEAAALALFLLAAATDYFDGLLARRLGQQSALGAQLDPLSDKALTLSGLAALGAYAYADAIWFWVAAGLVLVRDLGVTWLRFARRRRRRGPDARGGARADLAPTPASPKPPSLSPTGWAKVKTAAQMTALGLLFAAAPAQRIWGEALSDTLRVCGEFLLIGAALLAILTGAEYLRRARASREPS